MKYPSLLSAALQSASQLRDTEYTGILAKSGERGWGGGESFTLFPLGISARDARGMFALMSVGEDPVCKEWRWLAAALVYAQVCTLGSVGEEGLMFGGLGWDIRDVGLILPFATAFLCSLGQAPLSLCPAICNTGATALPTAQGCCEPKYFKASGAPGYDRNEKDGNGALFRLLELLC